MSKNGLNLHEYGSNAGYVAELLGLYESGSPLLDKSWSNFFGGNGASNENALDQEYLLSQISVLRLIDSYRRFGHLVARINPLEHGMKKPEAIKELIFSEYNFSESATKKSYFCYGLLKDSEARPQNILEKLQQLYAGSVGYEYQHLSDSTQREWIKSRIENSSTAAFSNQECLIFLKRLIEAQQLDQIFHTRFIGTKRFSIQGAESLAVLLQSILNSTANLGIKDITLAMAHRGRLNTMVSFAGKSLSLLCAEFEDRSLASQIGAGDVKYHLGSSTEHIIGNKKIRVTIPPNPSHLEFVNPVACGMVRAKQDAAAQNEKASFAYISIHGDASFAGQGIVAEAFNFSQLKGYSNQGTVHIIINNQVGFTTYSEDSRSTNYCSDLAKGYDVPVIHVNSDDVEAVARVAKLAIEFRQEFSKDIVIDLVCSRKYGHNEGDDPSFTQPLMYKELAKKPNTSKLYSDLLVAKGIIEQQALDQLVSEISDQIKSGLEEKIEIKAGKTPKSRPEKLSTKVKADVLKKVTSALMPADPAFEVHPKVKAVLVKRQSALETENAIDWGLAEALAYGSLMVDGYNIRISGQDSGRGTFSHRHLELHDYNTAERILPLNSMADCSGKFQVFNSPLSEQAVLAFDFGYSVIDPKTLVVWEAQFGDFANGAQIIIDQFIAASEEKWNQNSSIVLMLPHGFEGQGPEHSSARLERFLQLCSNNNMTVANLTNGAQLFHLLRKQAMSVTRKPLVLMSPKSMLRLPEAGSSLNDLTNAAFNEILVSDSKASNKAPVICCTGKVYYTLLKQLGLKKLENRNKIIRIEQLYPWPEDAISSALGKCKDVYWLQEEPKNKGAYSYILQNFLDMECNVTYFGRNEAAGVATGSTKYHQTEENQFLKELLQAL